MISYLWNELRDNIKYNKDRFLLTGIGIAIGNIAIVIIVIVSHSFSASLVNTYSAKTTIAFIDSNESLLSQDDILNDQKVKRALENVQYINGVKTFEICKGDKTVTVSTDESSKPQNAVIAFYNPSVVKGEEFDAIPSNEVIVRVNDEFDSNYQIGQKIYVNNIAYKIVGFTYDVIDGLGYPTFYFPKEIEENIEYKYTNYEDMYTLEIKDGYQLKEVCKNVLNLLNESLDDYEAKFIDFSSETESLLNQSISVIMVFLVFIAGISLLVAMINVVNIMYITALEKEKEIAIYRALGMNKTTVLCQFLLQSSAVVILFSILGYIIGIILSVLILILMNVKIIIPIWSFLLVAVLSIFIGVISGIKPALKATNVSPATLLK